MSIQPTFTVVTVVFNDATGLKKTSSSVLSQIDVNFEYIIKDGRSKDETQHLLSLLRITDRCRVVSSKDSGIYDAMNQALQIAKGKYVVFLNAGDTFTDTTTLKCVQNCVSGSYEEIHFFSSNQVFENGFIRSRPAKKLNYIRYGQPGLHQSTYYRLDVHKKYPYCLKYRLVSDYFTTALMIKAGHSAKTHTYTACNFSVDSDSTSRKWKRRAMSEMSDAVSELWDPGIFRRVSYRLRRIVANVAVEFLMNRRK